MTKENKTAQELALEALNEWFGLPNSDAETTYMKLGEALFGHRHTIRQALTPQSDDAVREALEIPNDPIEAMKLGFKEIQHRNRKYYNQGVRQALQSRAGQEGEVDKILMCQSCGSQDSVLKLEKMGKISCCPERDYKYVPVKPHPSRADAVDVDRLIEQSTNYVKELLEGFDNIHADSTSIRGAIEYLYSQGYLTQKPDNGMVNEWQVIDHENIHHPFEKNILCVDRVGDIFMAYQDVTGWYLTQSGKRIIDLPTHWMPLPPPPAQHLTEDE